MTEEEKEKAAEAAEATESQQPEEAEQLLPDGIGLVVEDVRAMLQKKHEHLYFFLNYLKSKLTIVR